MSERVVKTEALSGIECKVLEFVRERHSGVALTLLFGSALDGNMHERSDVDVFIVYEKPVRPYREKVAWGGLLLDTWVYDAESINGMIHTARRGASAVILDIIIQSKALPCRTAVSDSLKAAAERIREAGPLAGDVSEFRQYLTGALDDLIASECLEEQRAIAIDIYCAIQNIALILIGAGGYKKRHAIESLNKYDQSFLESLNSALASAFSGDRSGLIAEGNKILSQFGGVLREGYRSNLPEGIRVPLLTTS